MGRNVQPLDVRDVALVIERIIDLARRDAATGDTEARQFLEALGVDVTPPSRPPWLGAYLRFKEAGLSGLAAARAVGVHPTTASKVAARCDTV